jgi:hypothetical protein
MTKPKNKISIEQSSPPKLEPQPEPERRHVEDYATRIKREYHEQARYAGYDRGHGFGEGSIDQDLENEYWRIVQRERNEDNY